MERRDEAVSKDRTVSHQRPAVQRGTAPHGAQSSPSDGGVGVALTRERPCGDVADGRASRTPSERVC